MLINGKEIQTIPAIDRGLQFGDGCFTTAAIYRGEIIMFSAHIDRLRVTCEHLKIPFLEWKILKEEMQQLASCHHRAVLKVIITRGYGEERGYCPVHCIEPMRIILVSSWPSHYDYWRKDGVTLTLSPICLGRNPHLAGFKHLNRLEQVLISAHLNQVKEADEVLVLDSEGWIIECCTANLFWRENNIVYTPCLDQAGVNGIMRQFCLRILALSPFFQVVEARAHEEALVKADEVVICNALMPIAPVRAYNKVKFFSRQLFNFLAPLCEHPD